MDSRRLVLAHFKEWGLRFIRFRAQGFFGLGKKSEIHDHCWLIFTHWV